MPFETTVSKRPYKEIEHIKEEKNTVLKAHLHEVLCYRFSNPPMNALSQANGNKAIAGKATEGS